MEQYYTEDEELDHNVVIVYPGPSLCLKYPKMIEEIIFL